MSDVTRKISMTEVNTTEELVSGSGGAMRQWVKPTVECLSVKDALAAGAGAQADSGGGYQS